MSVEFSFTEGTAGVLQVYSKGAQLFCFSICHRTATKSKTEGRGGVGAGNGGGGERRGRGTEETEATEQGAGNGEGGERRRRGRRSRERGTERAET